MPPDQPTSITGPRPDHDPVTTDKAQALARLITEGRRPRSHRFAQLAPYRDVLLAERRTGASIRLLAESLGQLGVSVSEETLRVWLLRQKMPKRRKPHTKKPDAVPETRPVLAAGPLPKPWSAPTAFKPMQPPATTPATVDPTGTPHWQRKGPRVARDDF
jgi:hypothetical protein